jgi:hypothetical protein
MLAVWRVLIELSLRLARWRIVFLIAAGVAVGALLYQGKTSGELVYEHGVGMTRASGSSQQDAGTATVDSNQGEQHEASANSGPPKSLPPDTGKR